MAHVLITCPRQASLQLARQLGRYGLKAIVMPLYTFSVHQPDLDVRKALERNHGRRLALFTSPRAVRFGFEHIPPEIINDLEVAAVGAATRACIEAKGHQVHVQSPTGYTSEDLLEVSELATNPGQAVIFCAPGGRRKLANGLQELGWTVSMAMVYQREALRPSEELISEIDAAKDLLSTWTSISAIDLAREYLPPAAWKKILNAPALVISARIQHYLQQAGAARVYLAEGPGNSELLKSIRVYTGELRTASH